MQKLDTTLAQVDSVQEIRGNFYELKTTEKQLSDNKKNLIDQETTHKTNKELLIKVSETIKEVESKVRQYNEE